MTSGLALRYVGEVGDVVRMRSSIVCAISSVTVELQVVGRVVEVLPRRWKVTYFQVYSAWKFERYNSLTVVTVVAPLN